MKLHVFFAVLFLSNPGSSGVSRARYFIRIVKQKNIRFFSLLYIDLSETRNMTLKSYSGTERILLFLKNACLLDASLIKSNPDCTHLTLLTNQKELLEELLATKVRYNGLKIVEIPFEMNVPKGIPFYSAHFKIDAFNWLSKQDDHNYYILMDNDIVALNSLPSSLFKIAEKGSPLIYHIEYYTADILMETHQKILHSSEPIHWVAGEFIGGTNSFFHRLYKACNEVVTQYFDKINDNLIHIGDEMITTLAINKLRREGLLFYDAGILDYIKRYTGMHEAKPIYDGLTFVHLLIDKAWLSEKMEDFIPFDRKKFLKKYNRHRNVYKNLNSLRKGAKKILKIFLPSPGKT